MTKVIEKKLRKRYGQTFKKPGSVIEIDPRQRAKTRLGTVIHEALHQEFPELSERKILKAERTLRDILWGDNYRQLKK